MPRLPQELAGLLHRLNDRLALALPYPFQELVELERRHLHSEQQAALLHQYNALDTQPAHRYSVQEIRVRRLDQASAPVVHRLQALAQVVKRIPAQHGLEIALALLISVLHIGHQNDELPW